MAAYSDAKRQEFFRLRPEGVSGLQGKRRGLIKGHRAFGAFRDCCENFNARDTRAHPKP